MKTGNNTKLCWLKAAFFANLDKLIFGLLLIIRCTTFSVSFLKTEAMKVAEKMNIDNLKDWENALLRQRMRWWIGGT